MRNESVLVDIVIKQNNKKHIKAALDYRDDKTTI